MLLSPIAIFLSNKIKFKRAATALSNIGNIKITSSFRPLPKIQLHCRHDLRNKSISRIKARFFSFGAVAWMNWPQRQVLVCRLVFSSSELFKKCQWNLKNGSLANLLCPIGVEGQMNCTWNDLFCRSRLPTVDRFFPPMFTMSFYINCHLKLP